MLALRGSWYCTKLVMVVGTLDIKSIRTESFKDYLETCSLRTSCIFAPIMTITFD